MRKRSKTTKQLGKRGKSPCVACKSDSVEPHHIDADRDNNVKSNIEWACYKCHFYRHIEEYAPGRWRYNPNAKPTSRELVSRLDNREMDFEFEYGSKRYLIRKSQSEVELIG